MGASCYNANEDQFYCPIPHHNQFVIIIIMKRAEKEGGGIKEKHLLGESLLLLFS